VHQLRQVKRIFHIEGRFFSGMALIAGYVSGRPEATEAIRERVRSFAILPGEPESDYEEAVIPTSSGHVIVKCKTTYPIKPRFTTDNEGNVLVLLGFVISGDSATTLLTNCRRTAGRSLEEREGEFVAVFAEAKSVLHVVNDRFSSRPFYTLRTEGGIYFSSNLRFLLALARVRYQPDLIGWLQAFTFGHTIETRTTARDIERLRPASHLTLTPDRTEERQYWRLEHRPDAALDPARHAEQVFQAFRASAERRVRLVSKGVLALSGGLDSRLVAGALPHDSQYTAFTFVDKAGVASTPQTEAAARVAASLGLAHRIRSLPAQFTRADEVIALTGGMRPYQHMANVMAYVDELRRLGASFLLGGGPGDVLAGSYIPSPSYTDPGRLADCIEDAWRRRFAPSRDWSLVFRDEVIASSRRRVRDSLEESFAAVRGPTAAHRVTAWAMVFRQPAFTFTSLIHAHPNVSEAACHLDYGYSDLMLKLPASWLYQRAFYSYMIHASLPQLRHVPYANTGKLLSGTPPPSNVSGESLAHRTGRLGYSLARRTAGRIVRLFVPWRPAGPSLFFRDMNLLNMVQDYVHNIPSLRDIIDVKRCHDFLAKTKAGACPSEEIMGGLTSLCVSTVVLP
jgi:hypothetical protein